MKSFNGIDGKANNAMYYKKQKSVANQVARKQKQSYWEVAYPVKNSNIKETKLDD